MPSRDRAVALMRLCLEAYPSCLDGASHGFGCGYGIDTMREIYLSAQSIYGPEVKTTEQADDADEALDESNREIVRGSGGDVEVSDLLYPEGDAEFRIGVEALEWTRDDTTVLAFRGTYSDGDYANIENWMVHYLLEKANAKMKDAWVNDANLTWTAEMEARSSGARDVAARLAIRASELHLIGRDSTLKERIFGKESFSKELSDAVSNDKNLSDAIGGLTDSEAKARGYWKLTKHLVDDVVDNLSLNRTLVLTGHSQGGTRAQFASMYLRKKTGISHPAITFAATGSSCAARMLYNSENGILDDVDPFVPHPDMTDYVHPLDPWGHTMLGLDNGGKVCFWGTSALKRAEEEGPEATDGAYKYCSRVYGYSAPAIILARVGMSLPLGGGNVHDAERLNKDFRRCRYFTHMAETTLLTLQADGILDDNGIPDGGCRDLPTVPKDDPAGLCPTGFMASDEKEVAVGAAIVVVIALILFVSGLCCCCGACQRRLGGRRSTYQLQTTVELPEEEEEAEFVNSSLDEFDDGTSSISLAVIRRRIV